MGKGNFGAALIPIAAAVACDVPEERVVLGPHDGFDLPAADTGRVNVGDLAPDISAESYDGPSLTLSEYRGEKNVILVFYRGHW